MGHQYKAEDSMTVFIIMTHQANEGFPILSCTVPHCLLVAKTASVSNKD